MKIAKVFTRSLLIATISLPLFAGCAIDLQKTYENFRKPVVKFEQLAAWSCDGTTKRPAPSGKLETCTVCVNTTAVPQGATINGEAFGFAPGQAVHLCETYAIAAPPPPVLGVR